MKNNLSRSKLAALIQLITRSDSAEQRVFAALELFCLPASMLTVFLLLPLKVILSKYAVTSSFTVFLDGASYHILQAAAIGYLTNWIAIEMLFKPFHKTYQHWAPVITLGYWRQGLVPKNKPKIASTVGNQALTLLKNDNALAEKILGKVEAYLSDEANVRELVGNIYGELKKHEEEIVAKLVPWIEKIVLDEISKIVTVENCQSFWNEYVQPQLESKEVRSKIAEMLLGAIRSHSPELAAKIRPWLSNAIHNYMEENYPLFTGAADKLVGFLLNFVLDDEQIDRILREWLENPQTVVSFRNELIKIAQYLKEYMARPESRETVEKYSASIKEILSGYIRTKLQTALSSLSEYVTPELVSDWMTTSIDRFRPSLLEKIRQWIPKAIEEFDVPSFIATQINKKTTEEFYDDINEIAAQHFGAIQVLGFILGAAIESINIFLVH